MKDIDEEYLKAQGTKSPAEEGTEYVSPHYHKYNDKAYVEDTIRQSNESQHQEPHNNGSNENPEDNRLVRPSDFTPTNSIDIAHLLLSSSNLTSFMPELDKEIRLANLSKEEKSIIWQFQGVWEDILWLRKNQEKSIIEHEKRYAGSDIINEEDQLLEQVEIESRDYNTPDIFDAMSTLRKSQRIAVLSRGTRGFERIQQVSTITTNRNENIDQSESKPGFLGRFAGGFKK